MSKDHSQNSENTAAKENTAPIGDLQDQDLAPDAQDNAEEILPDENFNPQEEQIRELESQVAEFKDRILRMMAEFDNYKKRTQKEKESLTTEVKAASVLAVLPVLDNLERALAHKDSDEGPLLAGLELTLKQFYESFSKLGVCEIEALGNPFDPEKHNAVAHIEDDTLEANVVVEIFQKGYCIGDRIIRHSMVKVAN